MLARAVPGDQRGHGGFSIIDVPTREEALKWAATFAVACRYAQEVREIMFDPDVGCRRLAPASTGSTAAHLTANST